MAANRQAKLQEQEQKIREKLAEKIPEGTALALREVNSLLATNKDAPWADRLKVLIEQVYEKAPKLLIADLPPYTSRLFYWKMFHWLAQSTWVRPIEEWDPNGKGRESLLRSLLSHLLASYPMPPFIWSAFTDSNPANIDRLAPIICKIAAGGSLFSLVKSGEFPVPFTRKMCHEFLKTPSEMTFMNAIRRTQVKAHEGSLRLYQVWMMTRQGQGLMTQELEAFWDTVIAWFSANPMLDSAQVSPLVDYIAYRCNQDAHFSMKGRTPLALMRGMEEWHGELAKVKAISGTIFRPSGFKNVEYEIKQKYPHGTVEEKWAMTEVLSSKDLAAEGRALHHCVYSYAWSIEKGAISIWSLTCNGERAITVEVDNRMRQIRQARGRYNRMTTSFESKVLQRWATENGVTISAGRI
jgi:hypothetical protein